MGGTQLPKKRLLAESKCALFRLHLLEIKTPFPFLRLQNEHIPHVKKKQTDQVVQEGGHEVALP